MSIDDVRGTHQTQPSAGRGGFTLVELLAVIMIIALLAALVTPAVMRSLSSAKAAAVKTEIDLLHMALMNYKNEYGSFPPADMRGLWNAGADRVESKHPAFKHLQRIFPRLNEVTTDVSTNGKASPYYWMAQMSPAQALVFWLDGFFDNPEYPLTNDGAALSLMRPRAGTASASRKKLFDFDETRLYAATAYWQPTSPSPFVYPAVSVLPATFQTFKPRRDAPTPFARDYPVYFPKQADSGLPYAYFPSSTYAIAPLGAMLAAIGPPGLTSRDLYYTATSLNGESSAISPYFYSVNCSTLMPSSPQFSWAQLHTNPDTFQLIAAGADGTYGSEVAGFPGDAAFAIGSMNHGLFTSVRSNPGHEDNITNFATGRLKEAAEKLPQ
jgi:prepilin-type N-terminal cleavage/methylation domain-containing protein